MRVVVVRRDARKDAIVERQRTTAVMRARQVVDADVVGHLRIGSGRLDAMWIERHVQVRVLRRRVDVHHFRAVAPRRAAARP